MKTVRENLWPIVSAVLALVAILLFLGSTGGRNRLDPKFPANGPAEFLYLDGNRVLAYLAQFDGGTFTTKKLTSKASETEGGKLAVQSAVELEQSSTAEESISKEIRATAAGNYIELLAKLEGLHEGLRTIGLRQFKHQVSQLEEGQFVRFQTHALRPPIYLNPYLAVRQRETLATLFPLPPRGDPEREKVRLQRAKARRFRKRVGRDPRVVFALRPQNEKELNEETLDSEEEEDHVQYLMPMDAGLLTRERSLIKFGGGDFTVVGKVVRVFPEGGDDNRPAAYVDSPTLETWQQPLARAPLKLLCRTDPECAEVLHDRGAGPEQRIAAIGEARGKEIEALEEQTRIVKRGAVILPIAIYK
jgi:hypothetical protein